MKRCAVVQAAVRGARAGVECALDGEVGRDIDGFLGALVKKRA